VAPEEEAVQATFSSPPRRRHPFANGL